MPIEIKVGPPTITVSQGRTFMVTTQSGEIQANTDQGVYAQDTRFISFYRFYINRSPLVVVNSSQLSFYASRFHLTNPRIETEGGTIAEQLLHLTINRVVSEGIHEDIEIANFTGKKVAFLLELGMRTDFADLFEVLKTVYTASLVETAVRPSGSSSTRPTPDNDNPIEGDYREI